MRGMKYIQFHALPEASLLCNGIKQPSQYNETHIQKCFSLQLRVQFVHLVFFAFAFPRLSTALFQWCQLGRHMIVNRFFFLGGGRGQDEIWPCLLLTEDENIYDSTVSDPRTPRTMRYATWEWQPSGWGCFICGTHSWVIGTAAPCHCREEQMGSHLVWHCSTDCL